MSILSERGKELRRQYQREWRAKNKDKVQAINQRYWEHKAQREAEQQREDKHEQS